jgi:hypothetical protein
VVVNEIVGVPDEALALQGIGDAVIIVQGTTLDDLLTAGVPQQLDAKHLVRVRQAEVVPIVAAPRAEADVSADADDKKIVETALAKVRALAAIRSKPTAATPLQPLVWRPDSNYPMEKHPSAELRLLPYSACGTSSIGFTHTRSSSTSPGTMFSQPSFQSSRALTALKRTWKL